MKRSIILGFLFTIIFLWPTLVHFSTQLPSDQDGLFIIWTVNWISHALTAQLNFFNAPFFWPLPNTLAYSQPMLSQGLLNIPLTWMTNNLVVMSNFHLITGSILCFTFMYLLIFELTKSKFASTLASLIFSFGLWHAQYIVHLHTYLSAGIPLAVWAWQRYLLSNRYRYLWLTALASLYQILNDPMHGFFLIIIFSILNLNRSALHLIKVRFKEIALTVLGMLMVALACYWPYWQVSHQFQYVRTIRDAAHFAASIDQLFTLQLIGIYGLGLACFFLAKQRQAAKSFIIIFVIGLVLALGPAAKWQGQTIKIFHLPIPLPYAVFYYLVPGMKAFRAVSRWLVVANFGLALMIGCWAAQTQFSKYKQFLIILITGGWLWWFNHDYQLFIIPTQIPIIYQSVKARPEQTLAELPAYIWSQQPEVTAESYRLMYQNYHQKKMYNGASGFTPPSRLTEWPIMTARFPDPEMLNLLKQQQVELVIIHLAEYQNLFAKQDILNSWPAPDPATLKAQLANSTQLNLISCQENDCLYKLK